MWQALRIAAAFLVVLASGAAAQETQTAPADASGILDQVQAQIPVAEPDDSRTVVGILVLNQERFLSQSLYGLRIQREVEAAGSALAAENRQIEARLSEEELQLTELRATLPTDEFRLLAEEFDTRVEGIRTAQEAKARALQSQAEAAQAQFFELAFPLLLDIVQSRGGQVLMDNRSVLLSSDGVDITEAALERVNAVIGEGGPEPLINLDGTVPRPGPRPLTQP